MSDEPHDDRDVIADRTSPDVRHWLVENCPHRPITPDTSIERELGFDSMEWLRLTLATQQATGVVLTDAAVARNETVGDLLREVAAHDRPTRGQTTFLNDPEDHLDPDGRRWLRPLTPRKSRIARKLHVLNRIAMRAIFGLRVEQAGPLPDRQVVFAPTHGSYLDAFVLAAALDYDILARTFWAADSRLAFGRPVVRRVSRLAQAFPFDAEHGFVAGMTRSAAVLKRGHNLIWFPEGWLSRTGELQEFMHGIGMLLDRYPVPVVPVATAGAHEAYPKGASVPRPRPITVSFGAALDPAALEQEGEDRTVEARITSALRRHTAELYGRTKTSLQQRTER